MSDMDAFLGILRLWSVLESWKDAEKAKERADNEAVAVIDGCSSPTFYKPIPEPITFVKEGEPVEFTRTLADVFERVDGHENLYKRTERRRV